MTENAIAERPAPLDLALLKAVGLDRAAPEQRQLAIAIAERYGLDLMLKHLVLIEGRPYVTRDALLHIAHRSGQFDGIETTTPEIVGDEWRATATVWRKDMTHPFVYGGRYPTKGGNQKFAPEMCLKVAESMALRRAFDVSAPVMEERWDAETPVEPPAPKVTLAERAATKAAAIESGAEPVAEGVAEYREWKAATIVLPDAEPIPAEVRELYVNADELAGGARPVLRLPPSDPPPPWTRDRLHGAAVHAGIKGAGVTAVFNEVAGSRSRAELTADDWAEMAKRLGLA